MTRRKLEAGTFSPDLANDLRDKLTHSLAGRIDAVVRELIQRGCQLPHSYAVGLRITGFDHAELTTYVTARIDDSAVSDFGIKAGQISENMDTLVIQLAALWLRKHGVGAEIQPQSQRRK